MSDTKKNLQQEKDNLVGSVKEAYGEATGDQEVELKGKIQRKKAEMNEKLTDAKNDVLGRVNDKIDNLERK